MSDSGGSQNKFFLCFFFLGKIRGECEPHSFASRWWNWGRRLQSKRPQWKDLRGEIQRFMTAIVKLLHDLACLVVDTFSQERLVEYLLILEHNHTSVILGRLIFRVTASGKIEHIYCLSLWDMFCSNTLELLVFFSRRVIWWNKEIRHIN